MVNINIPFLSPSSVAMEYEKLLTRALQDERGPEGADLLSTLEVQGGQSVDYDVIAVAQSSWQQRNKARLSHALNSRNFILEIAPERGLDSQGYKCAACATPIGIIFGAPRVCAYNGKGYCPECFGNHDRHIPGRMLQNWDFHPHPVSKESRHIIDEIMSIPMLHLSALAPDLHLYVGVLDRVRKLRHQLSALCRYLNTCRGGKEADGWRRATRRFKGREYLLEHTDIYSVQDLLRVHMDLLAPELKECVAEGTAHVKRCHVCQAQGYICEICNQGPALFPFQVERVWKCPRCLSVYHQVCKPASTHCPKCLRLSDRRQTVSKPSGAQLTPANHS